MSASERTTETIPEWKKEEVEALTEFLRSYDSVGVVNVAGIPSRQLQDMRRELHGSAELRMSRNTLLARALDEVDDGLEQLSEFLTGQVGLVGTNDNPFGLYKELEASKTPAPINAGEVAPNDIVIPEGDTGIDPGPFVGELQQIGADARIQEGSIQVLSDSVVTEEGEVVSDDVANVLGELGIEPKEVGLDLRSVYSEGVLFDPEDLAIDVEEYRADIQSAVASARNLSINAEYPTAATVPAMLQTAAGEAKSVGLEAAIESPDLMDDLVSTADAQVRALAANIDDEDALPEELRGVEAPAEPAAEPDDDESDADETETDEADSDSAEPDDEGDEDDGAEGLGNMFGD
ncbi:50S ribosomal protein L10 [Halarchaeum nitratireducens]|uniref:Large ribosomal subunit protein uL10 n=1 Tax=Halarchaeum nitratireducens TaxID=489913 RepID=A0A830GBZ3_9EURY|nr:MULTISPECIES: 50S ribosomal protein L10 [Halarchaeum]MBP2250898.1 large subunit ribosomal protein L10 [Halarchaeum solikamskense]GGN19736.1 50S ribosomal protein L10 [Halarchaeum nitratireducens]